jgi:hypothetical protein
MDARTKQMSNGGKIIHTYEIRPRKDRRGFDLISDALPFGGLWYDQAEDAIGYAKFYSRARRGAVRVFDSAGAALNLHELKGNVRQT